MSVGSVASSGLPVALSSFVGRVGEIVELAGLLELARLLTLTGAPGIGKTRLALEVAGVVAERYEDGVRVVALASVDEGALLPHALAGALSVPEAPGVELMDSVLAQLARRRVLLVVDNCEHVIEACAELVDVLLGRCPGVSVLATSREPLALAGEQVWRVPSLSVPAASEDTVPELLMRFDAVRLFAERAGAVRPEFVLDHGDGAAVAEIARRLDGIPLAIELAAARVDMLTAAQIADRLDDRFALLRNGSRSHLPRHRTLEAAIDWSHALLSNAERALLRRLAVFSGGFCLEECDAVCTSGEVGDGEAFDLLARLVAKSLVLAETAHGPIARYRLLDTINAYAGERLEESGEAGAVREAHARVYLALAERAEPELTGRVQQRWLDRLETEHANFRSAFEWSLANGRDDWALRLAGALILFWWMRCRYTDGREVLEAAIRASECETPEPRASYGAPLGPRAKALWGAGYMAFMAGDPQGAQPALEESLSAFDELGDLGGCARALLILGNSAAMRNAPHALAQLERSATLAREAGDMWCFSHALAIAGCTHMSNGDLPAARPLFEQSLAAAAQDKHGRLSGLYGLGVIALIHGDYRLAGAVLEEELATARELGARLAEASALEHLGNLAFRQGEYAKARELFKESLDRLPESAPLGNVLPPLLGLARVARAHGGLGSTRVLLEDASARVHPRTSHYVLHALGQLAADEGDSAEARRLFEAVLEDARATGNHRLAGLALHELGLLARAAGQHSRAAAFHYEAVALRHEYKEIPDVTASIEAIGGLAAALGRHEHAVRLLGAANALRERNGYVRTPQETARYEADLALAEDGLSADAFQSAFVQGAGLTIEEAVTLASKGRKRRVRPASGWGSLTETEKQVAALVAEGLTNPQIAERMFVVLGTVKTHLEHIFPKLGVSTRRELEREVERHREPTSPGDSEAPA